MHRGPAEDSFVSLTIKQMRYLTRTIFLLVCLMVLSGNIFAYEREFRGLDVIGHPELEKLYDEADLVAFVKIVSGDSENYEDTIYKATVVTAFKGALPEDTIFFGPYYSYGIGSEYLIFLKKSEMTLGRYLKVPKETRTILYDDSAEYLRIMYGGYSILPVSFECAFAPISNADSCEYAVNVESIILPKKIETFPKAFGDNSKERPFVRKRNIEELLIKLSKK